jgi:polyhydroxybutyrate depolymerase
MTADRRPAFAAIAILGAAALSVAAHAGQIPALTTQRFDFEGRDRTALVHLPPVGRGASGAPLVIVFHGHGGSSAQAARSFRIHEHWPEAVVIYPQGLPTVGQITDPEGTRAGWQHVPGGEGDRDLKFVDALLSWAARVHRVDLRRVFAAGHSNGGSMVYVLWAARPDRFAGFAPSSSVFRADVIKSAPAKPAFIVTGRQDRLVPFRQQQLSLSRTLKVNAAARPQPCGPNCERHSSPTGADVVTYIHPGGHQLPTDAGERIVRFFKSLSAVTLHSQSSEHHEGSGGHRHAALLPKDHLGAHGAMEKSGERSVERTSPCVTCPPR